jgi:hypothetical protein
VRRTGAICALIVLWLALLGGRALGQDPRYLQPEPEEAHAIQSIIQAQLDAFQKDDAEKAFSYAAPAIRKRFGTAERFMTMVRESYAILYRPASVQFLPPAIIDGETIQALRVVGRDGTVKVALYFMERQADGSWKIKACELAPSAAVFTRR